MDIKSLWQKLDQIAESTDHKSIPESKKKKPDADGDGVPDWADKNPGKDDNEDKKKGVAEDSPRKLRKRDESAKDAWDRFMNEPESTPKDELQSRHDQTKNRIKTNTMAGPKGVLPEQGVGEGSFKQTSGQRQYGVLHSQLQSLANSGQINTPAGKQKAEKMIDTIQQLVDTDPSCAGSTVPSKKIWLSEQGVAEGSSSIEQKIIKLYKQGLSDDEIASRLKIDSDDVKSVLDDYEWVADTTGEGKGVAEGSGDKNQLKQEIKELEKLARLLSFEPSQTDPKTGNGYRPNYIKTVRKIEKLKAQLKSQKDVSEGSLGSSPDRLNARTGINISHKTPRLGQTELGNIPGGNHSDSSSETTEYMNRQRAERPEKLKSAIKGQLGKHHKPNLPEQNVEEGSLNELTDKLVNRVANRRSDNVIDAKDNLDINDPKTIAALQRARENKVRNDYLTTAHVAKSNSINPTAVAAAKADVDYRKSKAKETPIGSWAKNQSMQEDAPELKNVKHFAKPGGYGRKIDKDDESGDAFHSSDIDDTDDTPAKAPVKRGRGRPMKGGDSETGITKKYDTDTLSSWIIGNKPKNIGKIGKVSHVNRLKEYMEMVERKTIVEGYVAEGRMSELAMIVDDIIDGRLDISDIISGKFTPTSDLEDFVQQTLIKSYEETARDHGLHADDDGDEIIGIMYNDIHDIMSKALNKGIDEQAMPGSAQPDMTTPTTPPAGQSAADATTQQQVPVRVNGQIVGMAPNQAAAQQAAQKMTQNSNNQKELAKLGVTQVQESLSDTMNRFSSILNESNGRRTVGRRTLSESKTPKLVMEGTLEEIIAVHPHEHKMYQEGWALDEGLYEALCDHYYKEGRIPRKVWHGSSDDLRNCVEECYLQDTQPLMSEEIDEEDDNHEVAAGLDELEDDDYDYSEPLGDDSEIYPSDEDVFYPYDVDDLDEDGTFQDIGQVAGTLLGAEGGPVGSFAGREIGGGIGNEIDKALSENPFENEEMDLRRHAMDRLIDELDESTYGTLKTDMSESKKPSAGMTKGEKSSLVKKAKSGKDIGKSGKGFDKLAKKAGEKYGSAEKGKKVAAAAMWKNAAPTNEGEEQLDELKPKTYVSYIKKAAKDIEDKSHKAQRRKDLYAADYSTHDSNQAAIDKRQANIGKALDKMTNEATADDYDQAAIQLGNRARYARNNPSKAVAAAKRSPAAQDAKQKVADYKKKNDEPIKNTAKKPETKKIDEMDYSGKNPYAGHGLSKDDDDSGKPQYTAKPIKAKKMAKNAEKEMNKTFNKSSKKDKVEESVDFSEWDNQLSSLLKPTPKQAVSESAKIKKQMITESSNELSTMLQFAGLKNVQQVMEEFNASIYADDSESTSSTDGSDNPPQLAMPTGMGMSQQKEEDDESTVVEPMMSDEVIGGLAKGDKESTQSDNDHLSFFKKIINHGQSEVKTEKPKSESGEQSGIPASTSQSPVSGNSSEKPVTEKEDEVEEGKGDGNLANNAKPYDKVTQGDVIAGRLGKDEKGGKEKKEESTVKEDTDVTTINPGNDDNVVAAGNQQSGEDAGLAQGDSNFFSSENSSTMAEDEHQGMSSDGIIGDILAKLTQLVGSEQDQPAMSAEPPVMVDVQYTDDEQPQDYADEESQDEEHCDQCQSCGETMYENHQCMESLNEWANSPTGESADEQFQTDMDFMTKVISGGLNNQKQDQTTLPSTRVVTRDESKDVSNTMGAMLRKLSGIN